MRLTNVYTCIRWIDCSCVIQEQEQKRKELSKRMANIVWSGLRVVPLSLCPSCVTRKKPVGKKWPGVILEARRFQFRGKLRRPNTQRGTKTRFRPLKSTTRTPVCFIESPIPEVKYVFKTKEYIWFFLEQFLHTIEGHLKMIYLRKYFVQLNRKNKLLIRSRVSPQAFQKR